MAFDISKCAGCPLAGCGRPAELVGNPKAPYMVVTDVPTTFAASKGRLMSERASSILSEELSKHGFRRDDFLFVPQVRCAHEADSYTTKEKTLIRKTCRGHFLDAVSEFKPEVILPLGATPATQVVGRSVQITKVRGVPSHSEEHDCMLLALLHPGQVAMYPQHHPVFAADVASFRRLVDSGYDVEASSNAMMGDYKIVDDLEFLIEQQPSIVCIDTEDTSLEYFKKGTFNVRDYDEAIHGKQEPDAAVLTIQLCIKPGEAYMVVWDHPERPASPRQKKKLREQLRRLLCRRDVRVIGQNVKFDVTYLATHLDMLLRIGGDTLMLATLLDENMLQRNLDILTKHYVPEMAGYADAFNASVDKSRMWTVPLRKMVPYGCGDADAAFRLYHALWKLVAEDDKLVRHYRYVSLPGLNTLASMEMRGLNVDDGALVAFEKLLAESVDRQYQELLAQVPRSIKRVHIDKGLSFSRGDFVRDILFSHKDGFRLKPKVFTKTTAKLPTHLRVPSTSSKDHLPYFFDECPFTMALSQYVKDERLLSTSVRGFKTKYIHDGMVRPTYSLTVTVTGRTSCVKGDTPINTLRGIVRADAVVEGDYVFTHRGRWRRVVELFRKAPTMMYSLYLSNGEVLTVTGAHRILLNSGEWRTVHSLLEIGEGNALTLQSTSEGSHTHSQGGEHLSHATTNDTGSGSTSRSQSPNGACNDRTLSIAGGVQSTQEYPIPQEQAGGEEPAVRARMGVRLRGWPGIPNSLSEGEEVLCASDSLCGLSGDSCGATAGESSSPSHRREPEEQHPGQPSGLYGRGAPEDTRTVPNAGGGLTIEKVICAGVHRVYDFEVDGDHSYLACGVFNHNSENPNGQNFPKRGNNAKAYRRSYVAPPGYVVLEADLSQAELRISADMAQDRVMLKVYNEGGDIHSTTAATTLNVPGAVFAQWGQDKRKLIDCANEIAGSGDFLRKLNPGQRREATVKDYYKAKRQEAKAINFGFIYGMGWRKFVGYAKTQYGVEFTDAEAEAIRNAYFKKYGALTGWHERTRAYAKTHKQVRSYSGRIRHLPMIDSDDDAIQSEASRQAINSPVQEFGSSLGVMAMGRLHERMDDRYIAPIAFVHDAIYVLVPIEYAIWGAQTLKWYMQTNPIEKWFGIRMSCPIVADVSIGFNLGDTYEMEGLTVDDEYDYASLWDEEKQSGIKLPPQRTPPNNGTRSKPVYTYVD